MECLDVFVESKDDLRYSMNRYHKKNFWITVQEKTDDNDTWMIQVKTKNCVFLKVSDFDYFDS